MLKKVVVLALMAGPLMLAACSSNKYCLREKDYQTTQTLPPIQPVDGLQVPQETGALQIPPPPATAVAFGVRDEEGGGVCLDQPPRIKVVTVEAGEANKGK